jgi:hypothetical protein
MRVPCDQYQFLGLSKDPGPPPAGNFGENIQEELKEIRQVSKVCRKCGGSILNLLRARLTPFKLHRL